MISEKQELKEHIREVQKLAAAMGKRVDLRRPVSSKELHSDKKATLENTLSLAGLLHDLENTALSFRGLFTKNGAGQKRG